MLTVIEKNEMLKRLFMRRINKNRDQKLKWEDFAASIDAQDMSYYSVGNYLRHDLGIQSKDAHFYTKFILDEMSSKEIKEDDIAYLSPQTITQKPDGSVSVSFYYDGETLYRGSNFEMSAIRLLTEIKTMLSALPKEVNGKE